MMKSVTRSQLIIPEGVVLRVVIIRHGEKPDSGNNLSCAGLNRALQLASVLPTLIGVPSHTYVPAIYTGKDTSDLRMMQTVTPFAVQYNLTINSKHKKEDAAGVAKSVMKKKGTVLLVWEHDNIPPLAGQLGIENPLVWPGNDFDSIWILDYRKQDLTIRAPSFRIEQENIIPPQDCPGQ